MPPRLAGGRGIDKAHAGVVAYNLSSIDGDTQLGAICRGNVVGARVRGRAGRGRPLWSAAMPKWTGRPRTSWTSGIASRALKFRRAGAGRRVLAEGAAGGAGPVPVGDVADEAVHARRRQVAGQGPSNRWTGPGRRRRRGVGAANSLISAGSSTQHAATLLAKVSKQSIQRTKIQALHSSVCQIVIKVELLLKMAGND